MDAIQPTVTIRARNQQPRVVAVVDRRGTALEVVIDGEREFHASKHSGQRLVVTDDLYHISDGTGWRCVRVANHLNYIEKRPT